MNGLLLTGYHSVLIKPTLFFLQKEIEIGLMENIHINNVAIKQKSFENFLGLMVDGELKFRNHIQSVCSEVSKIVGILYKIKCYVPEKTLLKLY